MSELNIANFKLARQWLADWPDENFNMDWWFYCEESAFDPFPKLSDVELVAKHVCGTSACLGGVIEAKTNISAHGFLGLSNEQSDLLFYGTDNFYSSDVSRIAEKPEVLSKLDQIIAAGKWPDEFH